MKITSKKRFIEVYLLLVPAILALCGSSALAYSIPSDPNIGTWDSVNRIYTLTTDVSGAIQIDEPNLTLDGAGHIVTPATTVEKGISLSGKTNVTVKNVTVQGFDTGIYLSQSSGNVLTCNTVSLTWWGIWLDYYSNGNTVNGNTATQNGMEGIRVQRSSNNTITGNTISENYNGIVLTVFSSDNTIYGNNFLANSERQAYIYNNQGTGNAFHVATGGNYWSEWTSPDANGDGIVDVPYPILVTPGDPQEGLVDEMPLVNPVVSTCGVLVVDIDIKPGSYPNAINLGSHGLIPVAILSSDDFDATSVDPETVELAGASVAVRGKSNKYMAHKEDVNGDNLVDLVAHVATENLDPDYLQDGYAVLFASTYDGQDITGKDEITIVPPQ